MKTTNVTKPTLFGLWSFQFLTMMRRGVFYSFMYIYLFSLLRNVTSTAALGTLTMLMSAVGQNVLWGRISDRYKMRVQLIVIGEVAAGLSYIAVFLLHKSYIDAGLNAAAGFALVIGLAILEFFWSMSDVGWAALVTDITTPETRGGFIGAINFIMSVGRMTGIILAGSLYADGLGFRQGTIFYIVSVMLFMGAIIMWIVARSIKSSNQLYSAKPMKGKSAPSNDEASVSESSAESERAFTWFLIALIIVVLGTASIGQVFPLFLKLNEGLRASDLEVSFILSAWTFGGMVASVIAGKMADWVGRTSVMLAGLMMASGTPLLYGLMPNILLMGIVYGINGVAFMTLQTASFALAGDIIPENRRGRLLSRYNAVMALSWGPAGLLIGGPLTDTQTLVFGISPHSAYISTFIVSAVLVSTGALVFTFRVRRVLNKMLSKRTRASKANSD